MRVSRQQAAENREKILGAAARLFRERGIDGVGVDALAEAAGMTHGSVYSQFGSKERLAAEALTHALAGAADRMGRFGTLADYVAAYLSPPHRDAGGDVCAVTALGGEARRHDGALRDGYTAGVRGMLARIASLLPEDAGREARAAQVLASLVGTLTLARAVDDRALSDRILAAGREAALALGQAGRG